MSQILGVGRELCENFPAIEMQAIPLLTVIQYFWQLCMLRAHPGQVPTAGWFVALVVLINLGLSIALSKLINDIDTLRITTAIIVQLATFAALLWSGLYLRELPQRFTATLTAWLGCDTVITAVIGAVLAVLSRINENAASGAILVLLVWSLAVGAHIVRHAFNVSMGFGVVIAIGLTMLATMISQTAIAA